MATEKDRYYTKPPSLASLGMSYGYASNAVGTGGNSNPVTGVWNPLQLDANGNLNVAIAGGVSISGASISVPPNTFLTGNPFVQIANASVVSLTGNQPVNVTNAVLAVSGFTTDVGTGNRSVLVANQVLAISGFVNTIVTGSISAAVNAVAITGNPGVQITGWNTGITVTTTLVGAPIVTITGILATSASVTVGQLAISGFDSKIAPLPVSGTFTANIGNVAVTGYDSKIAPLAISGVVTTNATIANLAVTGFDSKIAPLAISGVVQAVLSSGPIVDALTSGNNLAVISNQLNSGISGLLATNLNTPAWTTGSGSQLGNLDLNKTYMIVSGVSSFTTTLDTTKVAVTGAPVVTITGVLATSTTVTLGQLAISGFDSKIAPLAVSGNITIAGTPTVTVGNAVLAVSGVVQSNITTSILAVSGTTFDTITGWNTGLKVRIEPVSSSTTSNSTPSGTYPFTGMSIASFGQALAANTNRVMFFLQNIHSGVPLYVNLSATAASTGTFSFILNPSTVQGWGGSSFSDDHYRGAVQVSGAAWQAWEI